MRELDFGDYNDKLSKSGCESGRGDPRIAQKRDQNYPRRRAPFPGAGARREKSFFEDMVRDLRLSPDDIIKDISQHLDLSKQYVGKGLKITFSMKSIFRLAWINTFQCGRSKIESFDLPVRNLPGRQQYPGGNLSFIWYRTGTRCAQD